MTDFPSDKVAARLQYPLSVGFVLDGSQSMEKFFSSAKNFAVAYFNEKAGSNNITSVGVVVSSAEPLVAVPMSSPSPKGQFDNNVNDIEFPGKPGGNLDVALKMASSSFFQQDTNANEILVIVTDGVHSGNREALFEQARELHRRGISVYAIGLGEQYDYDVLRSVAGDENRVRIVGSGDQLSMRSFVKEISEFTKATQG